MTVYDTCLRTLNAFDELDDSRKAKQIFAKVNMVVLSVIHTAHVHVWHRIDPPSTATRLHARSVNAALVKGKFVKSMNFKQLCTSGQTYHAKRGSLTSTCCTIYCTTCNAMHNKTGFHRRCTIRFA